MRSLICRFRFAYQTHEKTRYLDVDLKNQLFKLNPSQIESLRDSCKGLECQDDIVKDLHHNILTNIPKFTSFFAVKSIMYYYLQNNCNNQELWKQIGNRLIQLFKENKNFNNPFCFAQLAYIFGQLKRKNYIQNKEDYILYQQCSNLLIDRIPKLLNEQTPQNITHIIALINQYEIQPEYIKKVVDTLLNKQNFSTFSIIDIHYLFWSLVSGSNKFLVQFSIQVLENKQIIERIKSDFHQLKEDQQSKLLIALGQFRFNDKDCIDQIVKDLKIFGTASLLSLLSKYLKNPMHQIQNQYPIVFALKEQFDEYFQMEDKDLSNTIMGIKILLYLPSQINIEMRKSFLKSINQYEHFILNNIEHFSNESLIDILYMASLFESEKLILEKVQNQILVFNMNLEDSKNTLINFINKLMIVQHPQLIFILMKSKIQILQNIFNYLLLYNYQKINFQWLKFYKLIKMRKKYKINQLKLQQKIKQKNSFKIINLKGNSNFFKDLWKITLNTIYSYLKNKEHYNIQKKVVLDVIVDIKNFIKFLYYLLYLIDFRIYQVNLEKLNINELKQMQKNQNLQQEFLEVKQNKYDDVTIDRKNEINNTFIEIDGSCHFDIRLDVITQTLYKQKILNKYQINLKSIALNENRGISNSLQTILDIIEK